MKSSSKMWKPFSILGNFVDTVDDKILKGRWHSSKSVKSSSSSNSIRSNSICSASNLTNGKCSTLKKLLSTESRKPVYGPIFQKKDVDCKSLSNKFINNFNNLNGSRKNSVSQTNQSNTSSNCDLARSIGSNNSSRFSSTNLDPNQLDVRNLKPQKTRAFSTPNEEIFNLLNLPFLDQDANLKKSNDEDRFQFKIKQSKSYKEINSQALKEIEAFEKLLSDKLYSK